MIYGSVCSGIEAASVAWHPLGWQPKFFAEIEKFPSKVLAHHYGSNMPGEALAKNGVPNYGDFTKIGNDAGPVDLLVGGTPCQSFSVAGKRLGLDDPRGNLALEYLALARRLGARWIVWENVPGVLSSVTDEAEGEGCVRPDLDGRTAGDEWLEESDFATFLQFVRECGYGFTYRVLDAQFTRVDGYERAVPQRRRRVFLVGYLGDWRPAAAVLLEPEGLRGNPAPRRETGKGTSTAVASRPTGGGGLGTDFDLDGEMIQTFDRQSSGEYGEEPVASTVSARDYKSPSDLVAAPVRAMNHHADQVGYESHLVAHALRGEGFDASEDGTGRGTPIVPVAFSVKDHGGDAMEDCSPTLRAGGFAGSHPNGGVMPAVAFDMRGRDGGAQMEGPHDTANIRAASGGSSRSYVATHETAGTMKACKESGGWSNSVDHAAAGYMAVSQNWAVRRLTPRECERLQGFPDDYTAIPGAADGPRYKALGNSMAVNVMRAIGKRIDMMEGLIRDGRITPVQS